MSLTRALRTLVFTVIAALCAVSATSGTAQAMTTTINQNDGVGFGGSALCRVGYVSPGFALTAGHCVRAGYPVFNAAGVEVGMPVYVNGFGDGDMIDLAVIRLHGHVRAGNNGLTGDRIIPSGQLGAHRDYTGVAYMAGPIPVFTSGTYRSHTATSVTVGGMAPQARKGASGSALWARGAGFAGVLSGMHADRSVASFSSPDIPQVYATGWRPK